MFGIFYFIPPMAFLLLAIIFTLAISYVEKMPQAVSLTIGNLNADDIRKLDSNSRNYLKEQMIFHFLIAAITTCLIGVTFVFLINPNKPLVILPCILAETAIGLTIALGVVKKANVLKINNGSSVK